MDWAFDAAQSGYNFIPLQESYQAQLPTVNFETKHSYSQFRNGLVWTTAMRPTIVNVPTLHNIPLQRGSRLARRSQPIYLVLLQFSIGDVEGGDQFCSWYSQCEVLACKRCNRRRVADIHNRFLPRRTWALRASQLTVYPIDCGNNSFGVFSMVHSTEGLHAIEVGLIGLIPCILEILFQELSQSCK